jgi:hypothetical protein
MTVKITMESMLAAQAELDKLPAVATRMKVNAGTLAYIRNGLASRELGSVACPFVGIPVWLDDGLATGIVEFVYSNGVIESIDLLVRTV